MSPHAPSTIPVSSSEVARLTGDGLNLRSQRERLPGEGIPTKVPSENRGDDRDHLSPRGKWPTYLIRQAGNLCWGNYLNNPVGDGSVLVKVALLTEHCTCGKL
ncbi:protein of unknown function [Nitrospira defluvii]|uniref:Uncharacterized protein n=1 Tax=Nitrospira defluvii TaxID=330214 RepID=D8PHU8_9BACT|nr:protein of unknown function [Nitrospira defluvii]